MTNDPHPAGPYDTELNDVGPSGGRPAWLLPAVLASLGSVVLVLLLVLFIGDDGGDDDPPVDSEPTTLDEQDESATGDDETADDESTDGGDDSTTDDENGADPDDENGIDPDDEIDDQTDDQTDDETTTTVAASSCETYTSNEILPIGLCDSGTFVGSIQQALSNWAGIDLVVDGFFGDSTDAAVRDFQTAFALEVDGLVGPATWDALCPYSNDLCEPDGGDDLEPSAPAGIFIDGRRQNVLFDCMHYPFQSRDGGIADGHVVGFQYLVEDPESGVRRVVGDWNEDGFRSIVVSDLSEASVVTAPAGTPGDTAEVTAVLRGVESSISVVDMTTSTTCDTMFLETADGGFRAYGVVDVCQSGPVTVLTLNTFWDADGRHAFSEMNYRLDDGLSTAQLRLAGDYQDLTSASHDVTARNEIVMGTFTDDGVEWSFDVAIGQYPQGGHECVGGQVTD